MTSSRKYSGRLRLFVGGITRIRGTCLLRGRLLPSWLLVRGFSACRRKGGSAGFGRWLWCGHSLQFNPRGPRKSPFLNFGSSAGQAAILFSPNPWVWVYQRPFHTWISESMRWLPWVLTFWDNLFPIDSQYPSWGRRSVFWPNAGWTKWAWKWNSPCSWLLCPHWVHTIPSA